MRKESFNLQAVCPQDLLRDTNVPCSIGMAILKKLKHNPESFIQITAFPNSYHHYILNDMKSFLEIQGARVRLKEELR